MKGYGGVEIQTHSFLTSTLHGSGQLEALTFYSRRKDAVLHAEQ